MFSLRKRKQSNISLKFFLNLSWNFEINSWPSVRFFGKKPSFQCTVSRACLCLPWANLNNKTNCSQWIQLCCFTMVNPTAFFHNYCSVVKCMHGKLFVCFVSVRVSKQRTKIHVTVDTLPMWYLAHVKNKPVIRLRSSQAAAKEVRRQDQKPLYPWWIVNSSQMVSTEVLCFRCRGGTIKYCVSRGRI